MTTSSAASKKVVARKGAAVAPVAETVSLHVKRHSEAVRDLLALLDEDEAGGVGDDVPDRVCRASAHVLRLRAAQRRACALLEEKTGRVRARRARVDQQRLTLQNICYERDRLERRVAHCRDYHTPCLVRTAREENDDENDDDDENNADDDDRTLERFFAATTTTTSSGASSSSSSSYRDLDRHEANVAALRELAERRARLTREATAAQSRLTALRRSTQEKSRFLRDLSRKHLVQIEKAAAPAERAFRRLRAAAADNDDNDKKRTDDDDDDDKEDGEEEEEEEVEVEEESSLSEPDHKKRRVEEEDDGDDNEKNSDDDKGGHSSLAAVYKDLESFKNDGDGGEIRAEWENPTAVLAHVTVTLAPPPVFVGDGDDGDGSSSTTVGNDKEPTITRTTTLRLRANGDDHDRIEVAPVDEDDDEVGASSSRTTWSEFGERSAAGMVKAVASRHASRHTLERLNKDAAGDRGVRVRTTDGRVVGLRWERTTTANDDEEKEKKKRQDGVVVEETRATTVGRGDSYRLSLASGGAESAVVEIGASEPPRWTTAFVRELADAVDDGPWTLVLRIRALATAWTTTTTATATTKDDGTRTA